MTAPLTTMLTLLTAGATPATGTPGLPGAQDLAPGSPERDALADAFASLLAALAGVVPTNGVPSPNPPATAEGASGVPTQTVASLEAVAPATAWTAATQRAAVPEAQPQERAARQPSVEGTTRSLDLPAPAEAHRPGHAATPELPARTFHSQADTAAAPPVAAPPVVPPMAEPVIAPPEVVPAAVAPPGPVRAEGTEPARVESTHEVRPAILEAARGLRHEGGGRTSLVVRLDPPELGAVLVRLTVQDGRVDVQLRTPDLAARSDLQAQSWDVKQVLREQGFDLSSFDVAHGDVLPGEREDARTPDRGTPQRAQNTDGRPGTTHVTDDVTDPQPAGTWL